MCSGRAEVFPRAFDLKKAFRREFCAVLIRFGQLSGNLVFILLYSLGRVPVGTLLEVLGLIKRSLTSLSSVLTNVALL